MEKTINKLGPIFQFLVVLSFGTASSACLTMAVLSALSERVEYAIATDRAQVNEDLSYELHLDRVQKLDDKFVFKAQFKNESEKVISIAPPRIHIQNSRRSFSIRSSLTEDTVLSPGHSSIMETAFNLLNKNVSSSFIVRLKYSVEAKENKLDIPLQKIVD